MKVVSVDTLNEIGRRTVRSMIVADGCGHAHIGCANQWDQLKHLNGNSSNIEIVRFAAAMLHPVAAA
jgi:hypothetical protein